MFQKGDNNYKIFIFSAASLFASSKVLAYTNVVPMFLCPNIFCMVVICVPLASYRVAKVCRKQWNVALRVIPAAPSH